MLKVRFNQRKSTWRMCHRSNGTAANATEREREKNDMRLYREEDDDDDSEVYQEEKTHRYQQ